MQINLYICHNCASSFPSQYIVTVNSSVNMNSCRVEHFWSIIIEISTNLSRHMLLGELICVIRLCDVIGHMTIHVVLIFQPLADAAYRRLVEDFIYLLFISLLSLDDFLYRYVFDGNQTRISRSFYAVINITDGIMPGSALCVDQHTTQETVTLKDHLI